ncbi:MAG: DUF362 domain-containing protein, partial [Planctomycetes bacterium]|nr:DUF362 domain-containing protein [Planctomycetota bacterium]
MTNRVSLLAHDTYESDRLTEALRRLLEPLGGMKRFVPPGARVLLKPNLVYGREPGRAINTHPAVVASVAELVRDAGASWIGLGDSPGFGSCWAAARSSGLLAAAEAA